MFVNRLDGRPTGDAFVLFADDEAGRQALTKHKNCIGSRYIELFRTTQAEVQQIISRVHAQQPTLPPSASALHNRAPSSLPPPPNVLAAAATGQQPPIAVSSASSSSNATVAALAAAAAAAHAAAAAAASSYGGVVPTSVAAHFMLPTAAAAAAAAAQFPSALYAQAAAAAAAAAAATRRDCLRLRGLPYEAQPQQIAEFLGPHAPSIADGGIHLIFSGHGAPSGEAIVQMRSETAASIAAKTLHNKNMMVGTKRRYIEVFQSSLEDVKHMLNPLGAAANATPSMAAAAAAASMPPSSLAHLPMTIAAANAAAVAAANGGNALQFAQFAAASSCGGANVAALPPHLAAAAAYRAAAIYPSAAPFGAPLNYGLFAANAHAAAQLPMLPPYFGAMNADSQLQMQIHQQAQVCRREFFCFIFAYKQNFQLNSFMLDGNTTTNAQPPPQPSLAFLHHNAAAAIGMQGGGIDLATAAALFHHQQQAAQFAKANGANSAAVAAAANDAYIGKIDSGGINGSSIQHC